jgi:hypothetical protein
MQTVQPNKTPDTRSDATRDQARDQAREWRVPGRHVTAIEEAAEEAVPSRQQPHLPRVLFLPLEDPDKAPALVHATRVPVPHGQIVSFGVVIE